MGHVVDLVGVDCCDSAVGDGARRRVADAGDWGINSSAGQEKPRVSSISALRWFSIAAALGRSSTRSAAGGRKMWIWTGFWELGLFGIPVWRLAAGARARHCAVVRVRYVARNGDTARLEGRAARQGGVLTKTLISMGFGEMGSFGSSILAVWDGAGGWRQAGRGMSPRAPRSLPWSCVGWLVGWVGTASRPAAVQFAQARSGL